MQCLKGARNFALEIMITGLIFVLFRRSVQSLNFQNKFLFKFYIETIVINYLIETNAVNFETVDFEVY